jgi:hypothetical protein
LAPQRRDDIPLRTSRRVGRRDVHPYRAIRILLRPQRTAHYPLANSLFANSEALGSPGYGQTVVHPGALYGVLLSLLPGYNPV